MKGLKLHKIAAIGIVLITSFTYAQKSTITEENDLKFQTHFFEALKQRAIKNYSKAIESLEKSYEIDSLSLAVAFEFSKNYLLLNKYFEAEIFINKALETAPDNMYLLRHKVVIFKSQGNFQSAIEIQKRIVESQPKYMNELMLLYMQNKNFNKAERLLVEIEKKALTTSKTRAYKKYLTNRKTILKNANREKPVKANIQNVDIETLKQLYTQKKDYKIVQEILNKEATNELFEMLYADSKEALELFPAQPFLYKMNGRALNKLGKYNEAITVLTIGIDFVVDDTAMEADFYEQFSMSYEGLNNKKEALKYKQKAEQLRQEN
jgi:tetratricopeptide (TPR) repeat protein